MNSAILHYAKNILSDEPTTPAMMSQDAFFSCISEVYGVSVDSFEELSEYNFANIFLYTKEEDKKEFTIDVIRKNLIPALSLQPYEWKNIYVLKDFEWANIKTQNACLKLIEDCPAYAVIILLVSEANKILPTIHSRVQYFSSIFDYENLSEEINQALNEYMKGNEIPFLQILFKKDFTLDEAISILTKVSKNIKPEKMQDFLNAMNDLKSPYVRVKNVLESFFIWS